MARDKLVVRRHVNQPHWRLGHAKAASSTSRRSTTGNGVIRPSATITNPVHGDWINAQHKKKLVAFHRRQQACGPLSTMSFPVSSPHQYRESELLNSTSEAGFHTLPAAGSAGRGMITIRLTQSHSETLPELGIDAQLRCIEDIAASEESGATPGFSLFDDPVFRLPAAWNILLAEEQRAALCEVANAPERWASHVQILPTTVRESLHGNRDGFFQPGRAKGMARVNSVNYEALHQEIYP